MRQIAMDTATKALSVALLEDNEVVAQWTTVGSKQHGALLVSVIQQLMQQMAWEPNQIDEILVGVGPGSYTGVRVAVTVAKTWADSLAIPLKQVSSLALIAAQVPFQIAFNDERLIVPLMDARRLSAYTGAYRYQDGQLVSVMADCHADWQQWLGQLQTQLHLESRLVLIGDNIAEFEQLTRATLDCEIQVISGWESLPHTDKVGRVAKQEVADPTLLVPAYANLTVAEQEWLAKQTEDEQNEVQAFIHYIS